LEELVVNKNQLTSVDLSKNLALVRITIDTNYLTFIDVSMLTNLRHLNIGANLITEINVSSNTKLIYLNLDGNQQLTKTIDASNLTMLETLRAIGCPNLISINANNCSALNLLYAYGTAANPMNLTSIDITDTAIVNNSSTFRFQYNGAIEIIGADTRTFTNSTYHLAGNTITYAP